MRGFLAFIAFIATLGGMAVVLSSAGATPDQMFVGWFAIIPAWWVAAKIAGD